MVDDLWVVVVAYLFVVWVSVFFVFLSDLV